MLYFDHSGRGYSKKRCENTVDWFFDKYLPRHKIDLTIVHRGLRRESVFGWANIEDDTYRPRCFLIEIQSNLNSHTYSTILLHELWHVYQWVMGDLKEKRLKRIWKGIDHTETDYQDQPWEQEASSMEQKLYLEYLTDVSKGYIL